MKIDFNALLCGEQRELSFDHTIDLGDISPDIVSGTAKIKGNAIDRTGFIELKTYYTLDIVAVCSKCAEEFHKTESFDIEYSLCAALEHPDENEDFIILDGGILDIDELATTSIILNLPSRFICKKSCKGLCHKCGANLNNGNCNCPTGEIDPRLVKLTEYLKNLENNDTEEVE